jgi:hypothetical protein
VRVKLDLGGFDHHRAETKDDASGNDEPEGRGAGSLDISDWFGRAWASNAGLSGEVLALSVTYRCGDESADHDESTTDDSSVGRPPVVDTCRQIGTPCCRLTNTS